MPIHEAVPRTLRRKTAAISVGAAIVGALLLAACRDATGPDGRQSQLVFVRNAFDTLFVAEPNTGAVTRRIPLYLPSSRVRVSPSGDQLAFVNRRQLWVTKLDGGDARQIATNAVSVDWSPDGNRLVYSVATQPQQLRLINVDGSGDTLVPGATPGAFQGLAWSPDGKRIAFDGLKPGGRTVYVINTDGTGLRDVDANLPGPESRTSGEPTWSPDGKQLAMHRFIFYNNNRVETKLWVVTLATDDAIPITTGSGEDGRADWSPNGERIAFVRFQDGDSDVFVVRPDGSGLTRITNTPTEREQQPDWLPD